MDIIIGDKHINYLFNMTKNVPISRRGAVGRSGAMGVVELFSPPTFPIPSGISIVNSYWNLHGRRTKLHPAAFYFPAEI